MKTPLAWKNLIHNKVRTAVAIAGVGFAVILIFMQMGFKGAVRKTATQIYDALDFDLMLRSPAYLHLTEPQTFPEERVYRAASLSEVANAQPFYLGLAEWQAPPKSVADVGDEGQWRAIITMGVDPNDAAFVPRDLREKAEKLTDPRFVLIDDRSKPEFGPKNGVKFGPQDIGVQTALGPGQIRIVDVITLGTGLACNGACVASFEGFAEACPWQPSYLTNFGLVKIAPGSDPVTVQAQLRELLGVTSTADAPTIKPADVEVLTRAEVNAFEERRWVDEMPMGIIFSFGVWVALFVGVAIVYQVLSTDIANMMSEYATLKAMGYPNRFLTTVVLQQAVLLSLVGYMPSLAISWVLYMLVGAQSGMPMAMTWQIALTVMVLAVLMCVLSGIAALRKLFQADPADLF